MDQVAAALVDARPGLRVCDFCAGAGGKTLALAAAMENTGRLVACDTVARRLDGATGRLRRAGVSNVERRNLLTGDRCTVPRVADLAAAIPAISGKVELVYEGEREGPRMIAVNVLGREITAKVANLRSVNWRSLGIRMERAKVGVTARRSLRLPS